LGSLDEVELVTGMMALYQLWLARNNVRDCPMIEDPEDIAGRTVALLKEWHGLRREASTSSPNPVERWSPPRVGWHKANVDGAFSQALGHGGGCVVVHDHQGDFLAGASLFFPLVTDPERPELLAFHRAVLLAKEQGVSRLLLEMDF
jgi:hypothetical protein